MTSPTAAVVVDGVWKRFGATDVVRDLSFDVRPGELLGFLGPNGAGKTTTMRMILDIIRPDRGTIQVFGGQPGVSHQERVGYLPEDRGLYREVALFIWSKSQAGGLQCWSRARPVVHFRLAPESRTLRSLTSCRVSDRQSAC